MFKLTVPSRKIWQALGIVSAIAISLATASAALAGECPVDKIKPNARQMRSASAGESKVIPGSDMLDLQIVISCADRRQEATFCLGDRSGQ